MKERSGRRWLFGPERSVAFVTIVVVAVLSVPRGAVGSDRVERCQRALEAGAVRFERSVLRAIADCTERGGRGLAACLEDAPVRDRIEARAAYWRARVVRGCAGVDVHHALGYARSCGPTDGICSFASDAVDAPGDANDLVDCLACRVENRLEAVAARLVGASSADGDACADAIARPAMVLLRSLLAQTRGCLEGRDAISIAACVAQPDARDRATGMLLAWRAEVAQRCAGRDPFGELGHARLCSGVTPAVPPQCSDASPPCTMSAGAVLAPGVDDDLVDCLECAVQEAALGTRRDVYGAELCCDAVGCATVRSRRSCNAVGGHPEHYRQDILPGVSAGYPHGIAVANDGTVYLPERRFFHGVWTIPPAGPATFATLYPDSPDGITLDPDGRPVLTFREQNRIARLEADGSLTPVALSGAPVHAGDGGPSLAAGAAAPSGLGYDARGNLFFTESGLIASAFQGVPSTGEFVRAVDAAGRVRTVAGSGAYGTTGVDGPARAAALGIPYALVPRPDGTVLVGEAGAQRVLALDPGGTLAHLAGRPLSVIGAYAGDGGPAREARFNGVEGLAIDRDGNVLIADFRNGRVRMVDRLGSVISILGREDGLGRTLPIAAGVPATAVWGGCPGGVAVGPDGRVFVGDGQLEVVRVLTRVPY